MQQENKTPSHSGTTFYTEENFSQVIKKKKKVKIQIGIF